MYDLILSRSTMLLSFFNDMTCLDAIGQIIRDFVRICRLLEINQTTPVFLFVIFLSFPIFVLSPPPTFLHISGASCLMYRVHSGGSTSVRSSHRSLVGNARPKVGTKWSPRWKSIVIFWGGGMIDAPREAHNGRLTSDERAQTSCTDDTVWICLSAGQLNDSARGSIFVALDPSLPLLPALGRCIENQHTLFVSLTSLKF